MEKCHYYCSKFTTRIVQIFFCIIIVFAVALGFSYIIKVFVWFGIKKWEFTMWNVHISLIPGVGDLIIGGGTVAAFALIMCLMVIFEKLLCPADRHYNEQLKDYIINGFIHNNNNNNNNNNNVTQSQRYSTSREGETHNYSTNNDNYEEIELDTISTTVVDEDNKTINLLSSSSSLLFSSERDDSKKDDSSSSFDTFLNDENYDSTKDTTTDDGDDTKKNKKTTHIITQKHKKRNKYLDY